jgi:hypothetical protein
LPGNALVPDKNITNFKGTLPGAAHDNRMRRLHKITILFSDDFDNAQVLQRKTEAAVKADKYATLNLFNVGRSV